MTTETNRIKYQTSRVLELNKLNWTNKRIAETTGLSVIEVSKILIGD
jgi:CRP-like cAMP-binding protein